MFGMPHLRNDIAKTLRLVPTVLSRKFGEEMLEMTYTQTVGTAHSAGLSNLRETRTSFSKTAAIVESKGGQLHKFARSRALLDRITDNTTVGDRTLSTENRTSSTEDRTLSTEDQPSPQKIEPFPQKIEPSPPKIEPSPQKIEPPPRKTEPSPQKIEPSPQKIESFPQKIECVGRMLDTI